MIYRPRAITSFYRSTISSGRPNKKQKRYHYSAETIVEIEDRYGNLKPIRCLLDTGMSSTLIWRDFAKKGQAKSYKGQSTSWTTMGGKFSTNHKALLEFKFTELSTDKKITWKCHVDDKTSQQHAAYDMIIGMDLMTEIGIMVDTKSKVIRWEDHETPLHLRGEMSDQETVNMIYHFTQEIEVLKEAEERQSRILDADYSALDISEFTCELKHLNHDEQTLLKETLENTRHSSKGA